MRICVDRSPRPGPSPRRGRSPSAAACPRTCSNNAQSCSSPGSVNKLNVENVPLKMQIIVDLVHRFVEAIAVPEARSPCGRNLASCRAVWRSGHTASAVAAEVTLAE